MTPDNYYWKQVGAVIRNMLRVDLPTVKLLMQSIPGFWHEGWDDMTLDSALAASGDLAFVYEIEGRVVGIALAHDLGFRAYLSELAVAEEMHGQGIGMRLLEHIEEILRKRGRAVIISDVWRSAEQFYRNLGWSEPDVKLLRKILC